MQNVILSSLIPKIKYKSSIISDDTKWHWSSQTDVNSSKGFFYNEKNCLVEHLLDCVD